MVFGLRLGLAVGLGRGFQETRQIAPGVAGGLDPLAADGEEFVLALAAAEAPVKEAPGVVAQPPNDRRAAALRAQPLEQSEQQSPADPLVLPIRRDIERLVAQGCRSAIIWVLRDN